ncbi:hypothetical protein SUGI_0884660 [Cryptomeria japonica]|nr:hypothetical protein SUGI_0884660 [Cryptomeria japonica]
MIRHKRENGFKLNVSLLNDEDSSEAIKMVSHLTKICSLDLRPREWWEALTASWRKMFQIIGKKYAMDRSREESFLQSRLNEIEKELQSKGNDLTLEGELSLVKNLLRKLQHFKIKGQKVRARMNWIKGGDKGTNYFFNLIKAKNKREFIEDIQVKNLITNDPVSIKETFFSFYIGLFSSEHGDMNQEALEKCLLLIPKKISCVEAKALSHGISLEEIKSAISSLANGKSSGIYGDREVT